MGVGVFMCGLVGSRWVGEKAPVADLMMTFDRWCELGERKEEGVELEESGTHNPGCIWMDQVCMKTRERERESE